MSVVNDSFVLNESLQGLGSNESSQREIRSFSRGRASGLLHRLMQVTWKRIQRLVSGRWTNHWSEDSVGRRTSHWSEDTVVRWTIRSSAGYESLDHFPRDLHRLRRGNRYLIPYRGTAVKKQPWLTAFVWQIIFFLRKPPLLYTVKHDSLYGFKLSFIVTLAFNYHGK